MDAWVERYLRLLALESTVTGLPGLRAIVRRHLVCVPFENVSKLVLFAREGAGRPVTLAEFLDGIENHDLGGTCYSSNPFLLELLRALGYDAVLLGADMHTPDVHTSIRVRLDGREYHVDVGYAAPFAEPIPLDRLPYEVSLGCDLYVFDRAAGGHRMTRYSGGEMRHSYTVHQPPRRWPFFHPTVAASFQPGRTFMKSLRITRFLEDGGAVELRNRRLLRLSANGVVERQIESLGDLRHELDDEFQMPRCPVEEAVGVLERLNDAEFFGETMWRDTTEEPD
jgi:arylamine N-acetyltransferase